jgi:hypothetical protein
MMNVLNVDSKSSHNMIHAKNTWNDIYSKSTYLPYLFKYGHLFQMMFCLLKKYENTQSRVSLWYDIVQNPFISELDKNTINQVFFKTQRTYCVLKYFALRSKICIMKPKIVQDLELNNIELKKGVSMEIYQDGAKYYFTLSDLIQICNSSLLYHYNFFSEPYIPRNPYTNIEFTKDNLQKIYHEIRYSDYEIPFLLELLRKENYDVKKMVENHEHYLREEIITDFMKSATLDDKYDQIVDMLQIKGIHKLFKFDEKFPIKTIVKAFEPVLCFYLISEYSMRNYNKKTFYRNLVQYKILYFYNKNPRFGHKILKSERIINPKTGGIRLKWTETFIEDFTPIVMNSFPVTRKMIRYIMENKCEDTETEEDEDENEDEDDNEDEDGENDFNFSLNDTISNDNSSNTDDDVIILTGSEQTNVCQNTSIDSNVSDTLNHIIDTIILNDIIDTISENNAEIF